MQMYAIWWLLAGLAVAAELLTGTFYLLMFALGLGAAALSAHGGLSEVLQITIAAVIGVGAVLIWHWIRLKRSLTTGTRDQNVHLDIGSEVDVTEWLRSDSNQAMTRVFYRGSQWDAKSYEHETPTLGLHRIIALEGNTLVLRKVL